MSMSRLDAVLATIGQQADRAQDQLARAERLARESEALRVRGRSADGRVEVVVDGAGQVADVVFVRGHDEVDAGRLSAAVMEALGQAQRRLTFHVERLGEEVYGPGSPAVHMFSDSYRERFGYEEDED